MMTQKLYDDSNWREEYKSYTTNKRYIELLENGPNSLSQAWLLGALHSEWNVSHNVVVCSIHLL